MVWVQPVRGFLESSGPVSGPETQHVFGLHAEWVVGRRRGHALARKKQNKTLDSGKESRQVLMSTPGGFGINAFVTPFSKGLPW